MAKQTKKKIRLLFRTQVFARAQYRCEGPGCGFVSSRERAEDDLDAHHITDRHQMPNGGYVKENGIALCAPCHRNAESWHTTGRGVSGFSPAELYVRIQSTYADARKTSEQLEKLFDT